jgi:hypothetical protein
MSAEMNAKMHPRMTAKLNVAPAAKRAAPRPALALLAVAATTCGGVSTTSTRCQTDDQCDVGAACAGGTCIPRLAPPATWSVEIAPPSEATAAFTELPRVTLPATSFALAATAKLVVTGAITLEATVAPLSTAHVLLTVPAAIAGRPAQLYEADLPPGTNPAAPTFSLEVPAGLIGRTATLLVLPAAPDDATHAPASFAVTVAAALTPTLAAKTLGVRGRLLSAFGEPRAGMAASAYVADELVSNVASTGTDGTFTLMVPATRAAAATAAGADVVVRLAPPQDDASDPRYSVNPFALTADADLGDLQLPTFGQPNTFAFVVDGGSASGAPVPGALVRAYNAVTDVAKATTDFLRDGITDATGSAELHLLPGTSTALRTYVIAVVPPADSPYASACFSQYPLASGGTDAVPLTGPALVLPNRAVVTGTVTGADGAPVEGVAIVATPAPADPASPCAALAVAPPATTVTNVHGGYHLELDGGTYRFDLDPPPDAPVPRLTETGVVIPAASTASAAAVSHDVRLPAGALVEGTTFGPGGAALPFADVRLYDPPCLAPATCPAAPALQAQGNADGVGHFRLVVPRPSAQ